MNLPKILLVFSFLLLNLFSFSQLDEVEFAIEKELYKKALKVSEKFLNNPDYKKEGETYAAHALALYSYYTNDEYFANDNPNAIRDAIKSIGKGIKRDENFVENYTDIVKVVVEENNKLGDYQFDIGKYSKAYRDYASSFELTKNRYAQYRMAASKLNNLDTAEADEIFNDILSFYRSDTTLTEEDFNVEVYIYFIENQWIKKDLEKSQSLITEARSNIGDNAKLDYYQKNVAMEKLKVMQPGAMLFEYLFSIQEILPMDRDLIHKENAAFIYFIRQQIENENAVVDSTIDLFTSRKVARAKSENNAKYKEMDEFVDEKAYNIVWKISEYYLNFDHLKAASYTLNKYIEDTKAENTAEERWEKIVPYAYSKKSLPFSLFVLQEAILKYPENKTFLDTRSKVLSEQSNKRLGTDEYGALYKLAKDEYRQFKTDKNRDLVKKCNNNYFDLLIRDNKMGMAKKVMFEEEKMFGPIKDMDIKQMILARDDFNKNFFDTRVRSVSKEGEVTDLFNWDGNVYQCQKGEIPSDIQEKVQDRINYFRRNAGVPEISLDDETNDYCQAAALMMEANKKVSHKPDTRWKCFTDEGAYAAEYTLIVQGNHTASGITSLMADNENPSVGNRRWMLYPKSLYYGHGSTPNYTVVWALDDSGSKDTSHYMENPICWPPKGYIPNSMIFKQFSFGLYQDLTDAKVAVVFNGKNIDVDVKPFVRGYGVPTLVFEPKFKADELTERNTFEITVTLKNGIKYEYTVNPFEYNPNR